jgi:hypothetical protein
MRLLAEDQMVVGAAFQAASIIESKSKKGADVLARAAYRAALGVEYAVNRIEHHSTRTRDAVVELGSTAKDRPGAVLLAAAALGFALVCLVRSSAPQSINRTSLKS